MNRSSTIITLFFIFSFSTIGLTQVSNLHLLNKSEKLEVPFDYVNGLPIVKINYANLLSLNFIFDTGASHNILFKREINDILNIPFQDTITISGSDIENEVEAFVSRGVPMGFTFEKFIKRDIIVLKENFLDLENMTGSRIDGILGGDFFKGLVVELDYQHNKIILYNPSIFEADQSYQAKKIDIINHKPYLKAKTYISEDYAPNLRYLIDTGASLALLIHANKDNKITIPQQSIIGNLGRGISGDLVGYISLIRALRFGPYQLNQLVSSFQALDSNIVDIKNVVRDGIIGNVILSRFNVVIDYTKSVLYLKPEKNYQKTFDYDKSGLLIYAFGADFDQYFIKTVYPNTPARKAGILPGDRIVKIGMWPLKFYTLDKITRKLQGEAGESINMTLMRNGKKFKVSFDLEDPFTK